MEPLPAHEIFDRHALEYQARFMDVGSYHRSLEHYCLLLPQKAEILELACGPGNITRYLLQQRPDLHIHATDLAPKMVTLAQANNPAATCAVLDCRAISSLGRQYDGIVAGFCLPYLSPLETAQLIHDASALLRPGGLLYISTIEDDPDKSGIQTNSKGEQIYQYFHTEATLLSMMYANGLSIIALSRETDQPPVVDLILIARKQGLANVAPTS